MRKFMISLLAGVSVLSLVLVRPNAMNAKANRKQQALRRSKKKRRIQVRSIIKRFWSGMLSMILLLKMAIKQASLRN